MATATGTYAGVTAQQLNNAAPWANPTQMIDGNAGTLSDATCAAGTTDRQRLGNAGLGLTVTGWATITNVSFTVNTSAVGA